MNCLSKPYINNSTVKLNAWKTGRKGKSYLSKRAISYKELPALTSLQYKHALKLLHVQLQRNKTVITVGISFFQWLLSWKLGRFTFRKNSKCDFPDKPKILCGPVLKIYMFFSSGLTFIKLQRTLKTCQPLRSEQT